MRKQKNVCYHIKMYQIIINVNVQLYNPPVFIPLLCTRIHFIYSGIIHYMLRIQYNSKKNAQIFHTFPIVSLCFLNSVIELSTSLTSSSVENCIQIFLDNVLLLIYRLVPLSETRLLSM